VLEHEQRGWLAGEQRLLEMGRAVRREGKSET
jgi:hypothetical protein